MEPAASDERLRAYTVDDFAAAFRINRCTVYEEIAAGRLRSFKLGRRRLISSQAAADYVATLEKETPALRPGP